MFEEENAQYLKELKAEKEELEKNYNENANAIKLLQNGKHILSPNIVTITAKFLWHLHSAAEISRVEGGLDSLEGGCREPIKYFDIYRERPVRLTVRALVPVKEHPKVINWLW